NLGTGRGGVPCYAFPEATARVLGKLADYAQWRARPLGRIPDFADTDFPRARALIADVLARVGPCRLSAGQTRRCLLAALLPLAPGGVARTADEAVTLAAQVGFPVAVKLVSRQVIHKTEAGGVHLNVRDEAGVRRAFAAMKDRLANQGLADALEGVQVQPM